jgi:hypothetical protein
MSLINCGSAYSQKIAGCIGSIVLDLGLTAETDYTISFTFPNGSVLERTYTTDGDGKITLTKDADQDGFWNEGIGQVFFNVYLPDSCDPTIVTICNVEYTDFVFDFDYVDTDATSVNYPCECS